MSEQPTSLPIASIDRNPAQPREHFAPAALAELAESIRVHGILQPIVVRPIPTKKGKPGHWQIVAGERRWRAAQIAGLDRVPVIIREADDAQSFEMAMVENVIRADMDPMEEARGYSRLVASGLSVEQIAGRIGKSATAIRGRLRLLDLSPAAAEMMAKGHLSTWDANRMASLTHEGQSAVLRAMSDGRLPKGDQNAVDRLVTALREKEVQAPMLEQEWFSAGTYTALAVMPQVDPNRKARRELGYAADGSRAQLDRLVEHLEAGVAPDMTPEQMADLAGHLAAMAQRAAKVLRTRAAEALAGQLQQEMASLEA